jgi:hypothetical protein
MKSSFIQLALQSRDLPFSHFFVLSGDGDRASLGNTVMFGILIYKQ